MLISGPGYSERSMDRGEIFHGGVSEEVRNGVPASCSFGI